MFVVTVWTSEIVHLLIQQIRVFLLMAIQHVNIVDRRIFDFLEHDPGREKQ